MLQAEASSIDLPWEKCKFDGTVKSESMVVERDEEGRVGGREKDERLDSSRNATRLPICSPTTPRTTRPKS